MEFGKLTAKFFIRFVRFKAWIDHQNESQALTDQIALRKRTKAETLLRMQEMVKKRPRKKKTTAVCRIEESAGNSFTPESDPFVPAEFQQKYGHLFMI
jgi:hypothetical protein